LTDEEALSEEQAKLRKAQLQFIKENEQDVIHAAHDASGSPQVQPMQPRPPNRNL
jgi:hypothetical protein